MPQNAQAVLDWLEALVGELPVAPDHAALLGLQLEVGRRQAREHPLPAAELPGLTHAAVAGEPVPPPLAGACLCVWLSADLFDNVVDHELPEVWLEAGPEAATITALGFMTLVWKALSGLRDHGVPAERIATLAELFSDGVLEMCSGEQADLSGGSHLTADDAVAIADAKSGAQFALYARAGAIVAGAGPREVAAYGEYGTRLGTASQLMSDLADVCQAPPSDDLRTGALTLPVVHALGALDGAERERLERLLEAARTDEGAQDEARLALIRAGSPAFVAEATDRHRERALAALTDAGARDPAAAELRRLADVAAEADLFARAGRRSETIADELRREAR